ncbi:MAG TPA: SAV_6107 family HEPN domain-containing protein [Pseudonocardiaceae bacterium]|nr:SAV_6107 family HEPN domain-containing protein [Pseudonocardiaceae bacterium]
MYEGGQQAGNERQHQNPLHEAGGFEGGQPTDDGRRENRLHEAGSRGGHLHDAQYSHPQEGYGRRHEGAFVPHPAPTPPAGSALALVRQARAGVAEAQRETEPAQRYATAYLAALRAAAAMLALRGRPHRGRARPTSAWVLLTSLAPELTEWAVFFAASSATRAAILAGVTRNVTQRAADDLVREAAHFTDLVADAVQDDPSGYRGE